MQDDLSNLDIAWYKAPSKPQLMNIGDQVKIVFLLALMRVGSSTEL
jgi:hypothetical protein